MMKPYINSSLCIEVRYPRYKCNLCIEACSINAIKINNRKILIDENCNGCEVCLTTCPNGVFKPSRRGFFSLFSRFFEDDIENNVYKRRLMNPRRIWALENRMEEIKTGKIIIDETRCIGCNVCEYICPPGEIRREENDYSFKIFFDAKWCTGCGVCASACLTKAIDIKTGIPIEEVISKKEVQLIELKKKKCVVCDEIFYIKNSDVCFQCRALT